MKKRQICYLIVCLITGLFFLGSPVIADSAPYTGDNETAAQDYWAPNPESDGRMFHEGGNSTNNNSSGQVNEPRGPEEMGWHNPPIFDLPMQGWQFPVISLGVSLIILMIMTIAGIATGRLYRYTFTKRAQISLFFCHIISALLIGGFTVVLYMLRSTEDFMDPFISTMYATFGLLAYLALSSLIQAVSVYKTRPLIPLHQGHILFAVIAIILLLSVRIPVVFSLPLTILVALIVIIPGAMFSLITSHFTHKSDYQHPDYNTDNTITRSLPLINEELPPSFPEKLTSKYHDISVIGSGGMAIVYRAVRNDNDRIVALKIPFSSDETSGKTFLNEMSVWRDLSHPHIAQITDQNIFPVPYVELEYIPRSLKDLTLPVPPIKTITSIQQVGEALMYAHSKRVIHRDIKPGNVLFTDEGDVKLTDWGLSRFIERGEDTRNTSFSLFYASPEQLAPEKYGNGDQRTDIYQLGVLLYELLCGTPPYGTQNIGELFTRIQKDQYILPSEINGSLIAFDEIITRSLKADPADRYQSMQEFLIALETIKKNY